MAPPDKIDIATLAYDAVWQGWSGIDAGNVAFVRRIGIEAALNSVDRDCQPLKGMDPVTHAFEAVFRAYQGMVTAVDPECSDVFGRVFAGELSGHEGIPVISRFINKELEKGGKFEGPRM